MKVLIYSSAFFSDNTLPLYKALQAKGADVTLLYHLTRKNSALFDDKDLIHKQGIFKAIEYPSIKRYESYCNLDNVFVENNPDGHIWDMESLFSTRRVLHFIKKGEYDYIHTDILFMFWKLALLRYRKITIRAIHEPIPHAHKVSLIDRFFRYVNFKLTPKIVIYNHFLKNEFCEKYNIKPQRVLAENLGQLDTITVFKNINTNVSSKKIVFWGRISRYKGLEFLCEAMTKVHAKIPDATLVIAGSGDFYFDIEPYRKLPYIEIIHRFLDAKDLAQIISDCMFTVCPYVSSSQSGGVVTSLVMGKPVIGTDLEAMHEMIEDKITGLLVPPRDATQLANAIIYLLENNQVREEMVRNIEERNKQNHGCEKVADALIPFYRIKL